MNIDILAYELKYKNDQMVLDLLKAYQEATQIITENNLDEDGDYE